MNRRERRRGAVASIFLSYARENRGCAEKLAKTLEAAGHDVWWDQHIESGSEFAGEIEAELAKADVVLVAWSETAAQSPWVRDEAAVGRDTGRLLPVLIDGSLAPIGFRQIHALDLTGWKGGKRDPRTADLLRAVDRRLKSKGKVLPAQRAKVAAGPDRSRRKRIWAAAAALFLLVAAVGVFILQNVINAPDRPLKPTIALLPFTTASPDPELRQIASQARDSIAHTFSESGVPLRLVNAPPKNGSSAVDFMISGDVSRNGDTVLATVRLGEVAHGVTVYSHRFEAGRNDLKDLPERIGAQMAGNLTTNATMMLLDRRRPLDPELLPDLMSDDFTSGSPLQAYQNTKRVAAKAPDFPFTQLSLAYTTAFALVELPREERAEAVSEARRAAELSIKLDPKSGDAYSPWCMLHSETLWAQCEDRLRAAKRIDPDAPYVNTFLSALLRAVGRFEESMALARLAHTHDVYVPTKIAWMLKAMEFAGETGAVRDLHQQAGRWWPEYKPMFFRNRMYSLIDRGDFEAMPKLEQEVGVSEFNPDYEDSKTLVAAMRSKSITAARRACPESDAFLLNLRCMIALSKLGDQDGAYAIANKLYPRRIGRTPAETERIWLDEPEIPGPEFIASPAAASMRRDPRYLQLIQRIGLLAYWRSGRLPDFCKRDPEPVCKQLMKKK